MIYDLIKDHLGKFNKRTFKRGQIIYNEGDTPKSIFVNEKGIIGLFHISETGHETLLRVFSKRYIFGHRSYMAKEAYHASAVCLTSSEVYEIPESAFREICSETPDLLFEISRILAKELRSSEIRMSDLQDKSANQRIVESLVFLKLKHPDYTWTRKEIAEFAGSTLESVVRVMSLLQDEGLLEKNGRDFSINDVEKVLDRSQEL